MPDSPSLTEIVTKLGTEHNNSTLGWDVVVNYKESEINALLEQVYHNDPKTHVTELDIELFAYDQDANPYKITFHFELGPPRIKFTGAGVYPSCELYIPINGGQTKAPTQTSDIHAGAYEIRLLSIPMATMSGSTGELSDGGKPFIFPPQGSGTAAVTLDMRVSSESKFSVKLEKVNGGESAQNEQVNAHLGDLEKRTRAYFVDPANVTSIQCKLASIDSTPPPADYIAFRPTFFRFGAYHSEAHPTTILSLFIQTSEVATGVTADLQQAWTKQWAEKYNVSPIPDTHSASIIFNNTTIHRRVICAALQQSNVEAGDPSFGPGKGYAYSMRPHKTVEVPAVHRASTKFDGVHVNLDDDDKTLRLTLGQNEKPGEPAAGYVTWNYTYEFQYNMEWFVPGSHIMPIFQSGTCTVKNSLSKTSALSTKLSDDTLEMDLAVSQNDWDKPDATKTAADVFKTVFDTDYPAWFDSTRPSVDIRMARLYFFLTTNLLAPGTKAISIDANAGLRIPHDFYTVGNVVR